jgi:manganese oxidase
MINTKSFKRSVRLAFIVGLLFSVSAVSTALTVSASTDVIQGTIWVADEYGNSITVIDASTNEVITTLTGIEEPHNLQVSPDGRTVWAVSGHDSIALVIDASTYTLLGTVGTGDHPAHVVITPDGSTVYVTDAGANTVTVIDAATLEVVATIPVGVSPHGLRPSPDGRWIYVANTGDTTLSVIDTGTNSRVADIEVGQRPVQVAFSPDGEYVYVSLNQDNTLGKVDTASGRLVDTVEVGFGPIQVFVTPDNRYVLAANQGTETHPGTTVSVIDTTTFSVTATVDVGAGAHGVVVEPSGQYAYIANIYGNNVAVLDLADLDVVATISTGAGPNGISFSPLPASPAPAREVALATQPATGADDHAAHHPAETPSTPVPDPIAPSGMMGMEQMGTMMSMMQEMMGMEMSGEMLSMMGQMQGMMAMMMAGGDMSAMTQQMHDMMEHMMSMDMPHELHTQMQQMQGMMNMMMAGMDGHSPADMGGHDMGPVSSEGVPLATQDVGGQPLDYRLEDGVKVFEITAQPVLWNILDDVTVTAWTYNGTVPGPMIRVTEGDQVRVIFTNNLPQPTTVHWHGILVPNAMDGVPGVTQDPILPGETFIYEFTANPAGTFMYHSHFESDMQIGLGLYAPFIIDPAQPQEPAPDVDVTLMFSEWRVVNGQTYPAMPMAALEPNYFTINGKAFPATETINVRVGQRVRLRLASIGQFNHPMHLHGMPFQIVATDGYPVPEVARLTKDTVSVDPGERYDIEFVATEVGQWMLHCHITHHTTNDGHDPGGLMLIINVTE